MPAALILIADGTEETEFVATYDVLVRAGFSVKSVGVGLKNEFATCTRNIRIIPDEHDLGTFKYNSESPEYDVLILPGGGPGAATFCASEPVLEVISAFRVHKKWVAAICAGTTALVANVKKSDSGSEEKGTVTSHPSVEAEIKAEGWTYSQERCVVDDRFKLITSRGPGTVLLFALTIVEQLCGREKRKDVEGPMLMPASDSLDGTA
ncbi:DJ-1 [Mytilinidion resinicola]|uniref:D-lactate dehydratase n=1 Tax=Mytilinidion resinicola TaxID=574789 RepID=A0A6A6YNN3_9PEZI|nr:DJ-1 [Mytilinidion resinicola]KAF2810193.1 DJ-1 [Mytilinidion resinicola]